MRALLSLWLLAAAPEASYEDERLASVLAAEGLALDPAPAGKRIAFVQVVLHEVFAEDEPYPLFLNDLRFRTREPVVRRELLLREGEPWDAGRAEETARNLRALGIFSLVRVVPVAAPGPGEVGVLVYTRDLWSLRLEQSFQVTGSHVDQLLLQLTERNLLGENLLLTTRFVLLPDTYLAGQVFRDRRVLGGPLTFAESFDLIFNRTSNEPEGSRGAASLGVPLYDLASEWGFQVSGGWDVRTARQLQGDALLTYDVPDTAEVEALGRAWKQGLYELSAAALRRVPGPITHDLVGGVGFTELTAKPAPEAGVAPEQEAAFARDVLPRERRQVFPYVKYLAYTPAFTLFEELDSFGQTEEVRTGPSWSATLSAPLTALGSSSDGVLAGASTAWLVAGGDALAGAEVEAQGFLEEGALVDQVLIVGLRGATPRFGPLRVVTRGTWVARREDTQRTLVTLGGDNGLRAYPSQAFVGFGASAARANVELRTAPLVLRSVHLGGAAFWDAGTVYDELATARLHHGAGIGLRFLLPQFNRDVYRLDAAVPLEGGGFTVNLGVGSGQAAPVKRLEGETLDPTPSRR